jgi:ribosome-associated toxin RatA of RatAB toxin-antitoxin module
MADSSMQSIVIDATPAQIAAVICDFGAYPQWIPAMKRTDVLSQYEDGYAADVTFALDAGVVSDEYTVVYEYSEDLSHIEWKLVKPSKMQKVQNGSYDLVDNGDGTTTVTYTLEVDLTMPVLGMFKRKAEKAIMDAALGGLKKRVEGTK